MQTHTLLLQALMGTLLRSQGLTARPQTTVSLMGVKAGDGACQKEMNWPDNQKPDQAGGFFDQDQLSDHLTLYKNVWGYANAAPSSSQSVKCHSFQNGILSWATTFDLKSARDKLSEVKSYCNVAWEGSPMLISSLKAIPAVWHWELSKVSSDAVLDVAWDIFTTKSSTCTARGDCKREFEIMIWLGVSKASPIGHKVSSTPLASGKYSFDVYKGNNGHYEVLSLIPSQPGTQYSQFEGDLMPLLKGLQDYGVEPSQYINSVGAGTEPFVGAATLTTSRYTIDVQV